MPADLSPPLVGRRSRCCKDMWTRYCCLTIFSNSIHALLWPTCVAGSDIIFFALWFLLSFFLFFYSPNLSGRIVDVYHTSFYTWCGLSANFEYRSEMCCMRLAGNTGRKNDAKNRNLGTIAQLCQAESLQLRHVSTIRNKTC